MNLPSKFFFVSWATLFFLLFIVLFSNNEAYAQLSSNEVDLLVQKAMAEFNVAGIEIGKAAVLGQMTTGFPVSPLTGSTYVLIGLTGIDLGEHQKRTIPYAFAFTLFMLLISILIGAIVF